MHRTSLRRGTAAALLTTAALATPAHADELLHMRPVKADMAAAGRAAQRAHLVRAIVGLEHRLHMPAHRRRLAHARLSALRKRLHTLRLQVRRERAYGRVAVPAALQAIAACESGGNPRAIGGGGAYRGKYQFSYATWAAVGGSGDPAAAPEAEQDMRAALLYARAGAGQWPVCGR